MSVLLQLVHLICASCSGNGGAVVPSAVGVAGGAAGIAGAAAGAAGSAAGAGAGAGAGPGLYGDPDMTSSRFMDGSLTHDANGHHLSGGVIQGTWRDGTSVGAVNANVDIGSHGVHADYTTVGMNVQGSIEGVIPAGFQANAGDAMAEAVWDRQGYYGVGAEANYFDAAVNTGPQQGDPSASDDLYAKAGASAGVRGAAHVYAGTDVDGDGVREVGVGADIGVASFDVRVEHPAVNAAADAIGEFNDGMRQALHDTPPSHYK